MAKIIILSVFALMLLALPPLACDDDDDDETPPFNSDTPDDDDFFDDDDNTDDDDDDDNNVDDDDDDISDDDDDDDDDSAAPQFSSNHNATWNCYLCHQGEGLFHATGDPHSGAYVPPGECLSCHTQGSFETETVQGGHFWAMNCLNCHQDKHGKTWDDKSQCLICHGSDK